MKKILSSSLFIIALAVAFTGCLKDKGFDNNTYGINDPDTQPPGVAFPLAVATQGYGLDVSGSTQVVSDLVYVNLESGVAASSAVNVTLTNTTATQVAAYNTANGLTGTSAVLAMPASAYNVALALTIPAGGRNVMVPINVTSTLPLDATRSYAIGLTISAVDGGYRIAENLKNLFIIFNIKNRLDGRYEITGAALRAGDPLLTGPFGPYERDLATFGANAVQWQGQVLWANGGNSALPGGYEPLITVDPVTNLVTSIGSPNGIFMTGPVVRTDIVGTTQRYDVPTKTLYFEFSYGGGPASRLFSFKARFLRAR